MANLVIFSSGSETEYRVQLQPLLNWVFIKHSLVVS